MSYKAYKTEIDPNNVQAATMQMFCDARTFIYNIGLMEWERQHKYDMKPSDYKLKKQFTEAKKSIYSELFNWKHIPFSIQDEAFASLGNAYKNFFRRLKKGEKPGHPRKSRGGSSFSLKNTKIEANRVKLTHVGWVRLKEHDYIPTDAKYGVYATVSKRAGRWFISVLVKNDSDDASTELNNIILGIDLGIKSVAVLSNGKIFDNTRVTKKYENKLARLQREMSRRKKGSQNWKKTVQKIQRTHYKIACTRNHNLQQISDYVTKKVRPKKIVLENLNVSGMVKNRKLAKAISDVGMSELRRQIEYKAERMGIEVIIADRFFPSSKKCSGCGERKGDLKLGDRTYVCANCGLVIDRDINAAKNLAAYEPSNGRGLPVELTGLPVTEKQEGGISNE